MRERVPDTERGEAERLRERSQDDEVGKLVDPGSARARAVLDVRLVGDDDRLRCTLGQRRDLLGLDPAPGGVVGVADPVEVGVLAGGGEVRPAKRGRDPVQRVRRSRHRGAPTRPEEHLREQEDEVVRSGADDDVLGGEAHVGGSGFAQLAVGPVRVLVEPRHALREGHLRHAGKRGRVLVELQDGLARHAVPLGDLVDGRRPDVGRVAGADGLGDLAHRAHAAAAACSGSPSARASGTMTSAARRAPSGVAVTTWTGLRKASMPSPPVDRARPPVGRTCVAPAA